ncbi:MULTISPECIES: serine protease [unclassified Methylophilus]|uniref:S1 family peptidase n=1 Tax=unclassified Methylophilus TaxID=2630143 RepID=UPI0006FEB341|nr:MULTISPECIES: serine protease [unclassified Methylophilus]KQT42600.1 peptidase S1 [Methylophilus sp. Leaf416]KQT56784.1 peptidase S1 [Methylophilus sp. Leaf459]
MRTLFQGFIALTLLWSIDVAFAEPDRELVYKLKASIVKVHVITQTGGHGVGTGVVVAKDTVATNCHVLANSNGISISKFGESISPVGMVADWPHDACLLKFQYLELAPVKLASADSLNYGDDVFTIGFPGGPPKPQTIAGKVRALYPYDGGTIVRSDAAFIMGSSGSPTFNQAGELVSLSTFKSPGKHAYFYSIPVEWVQALMQKNSVSTPAPDGTPFWDLPPLERPYWMQVVQPYQNSDWKELEAISRVWSSQQPNSAEAAFYLASALHGQGQLDAAQQAYQQSVALQPAHIDAWIGLAILAQQKQQTQVSADAENHIRQLDPQAFADLQQRLQENR